MPQTGMARLVLDGMNERTDVCRISGYPSFESREASEWVISPTASSQPTDPGRQVEAVAVAALAEAPARCLFVWLAADAPPQRFLHSWLQSY